MKAQKYSNCFQMMEQRGNFNGIDTCNVTQYRNFKLLSVLLEENECRSISGRPDINALLDQFIHEKHISPELAKNYRELARMKSHDFDSDRLSYGSTYVPAKIAIQMQQEKQMVKIMLDANDNHTEETKYVNPQFPAYLYPVQKCHEFGATPISIPTYIHKEKNTSMLWSLTGILSLVEEVWAFVTKIDLRQSNWHGWMLTYIANRCLTHHRTKAFTRDPFKMSMMKNTTMLMEKIVSSYYH